MAKNLTDLTARTATEDSDLIHVNSGGTDYKQTKADFLKGGFGVEFSFLSSLTGQADSLPLSATYFGYLWNYGHIATSGVPINTLCYIKIANANSRLYSVIEAWSAADPDGQHYIICKNNGTWESSWTKCASRVEITSLTADVGNRVTKWPSNIASYAEFDALAVSGGFYSFRTSQSFACGNGTMPNYGRGLIMNYSSTDSTFILVCPTGFVYGFKNSGNWILKQISF